MYSQEQTIRYVGFDRIQYGKPIRIVYTYDRKHIDSVEIIINKNQKTIHHKNYRLWDLTSMYAIDSTPTVGYGMPGDTIEVIIRGYKGNLYCFPMLDKLPYPYFRISYGVNFECSKLKT